MENSQTFEKPPGLEAQEAEPWIPASVTLERWRLPVAVKKLHPDAVVPSFATPGSAGFDLAICEDTVIAPDKITLARTGLVIATPPGHMLMMAVRSSTGKRWGVRLANQVAIIDSDYCGDNDEIFVQLIPLGLPGKYKLGLTIPAGTRVAQGIFVPVTTKIVFQETTGPMGQSRGGWGSTGV
jgi:dUTP pyrophosphatase